MSVTSRASRRHDRALAELLSIAAIAADISPSSVPCSSCSSCAPRVGTARRRATHVPRVTRLRDCTGRRAKLLRRRPRGGHVATAGRTDQLATRVEVGKPRTVHLRRRRRRRRGGPDERVRLAHHALEIGGERRLLVLCALHDRAELAHRSRARDRRAQGVDAMVELAADGLEIFGSSSPGGASILRIVSRNGSTTVVESSSQSSVRCAPRRWPICEISSSRRISRKTEQDTRLADGFAAGFQRSRTMLQSWRCR